MTSPVPDNLLSDTIDAMDWMTTALKYSHDESRSAFGFESDGGYSPELIKALNALEKLKQVKETEQ